MVFKMDHRYAILVAISLTAPLHFNLARWKPWIPPKLEQGLQQGGTFVFRGDREIFSHYDPSTGAHANLATVLAAALEDGPESESPP